MSHRQEQDQNTYYHSNDEGMEEDHDRDEEEVQHLNADDGYDEAYDDSSEDDFNVDLSDAVEVPVDDSNIPMEEDDDEDYDDKESHLASMGRSSTSAVVLPDMSIGTFHSHRPSSVFCVASHYLPTTDGTTGNKDHILIVSGGGDDRAFLHQMIAPNTAASTGTDTTTTAASSFSLPLSHVHTDSVSCVASNMKFLHASSESTNAESVPTHKPYIAVGSYDGSIMIYDPTPIYSTPLPVPSPPSTLKPILKFDGPTDVEFLTFHPKGGSVLLAGSISDGTIWMYHIPSNKCLQVFVGHECNSNENGGVTAGYFTPDGKFAVSIGMDGTMRIWAPRTGQCRHVFKLGGGTVEEGGGGLTCLAMDGGVDGQFAVAGGEDGIAHVVHLQSKKVIATLRHFDPTSIYKHDTYKQTNHDDDDDSLITYSSVEAVAFAPRTLNPNWVATGGSDGLLKIWDLTYGDGAGQCRQTCFVTSAISPSIPEESMTIDTHSGNVTNTTNPGGVTRIVWHPALPVIFASYADGVVRVWDARSGSLLHSLTGGGSLAIPSEDNQINDMTVEFTGMETVGNGGIAIVVTGCDDGTVKVFRLDLKGLLR